MRDKMGRIDFYFLEEKLDSGILGKSTGIEHGGNELLFGRNGLGSSFQKWGNECHPLLEEVLIGFHDLFIIHTSEFTRV